MLRPPKFDTLTAPGAVAPLVTHEVASTIGGFKPAASDIWGSEGSAWTREHFGGNEALLGSDLEIDLNQPDGLLAARIAALDDPPFLRRWILTHRLNNLGGTWSPLTKLLAQTGLSIASEEESAVFGAAYSRVLMSGEVRQYFRTLGHMYSEVTESGGDFAYGMTVDFLRPDVRFNYAATFSNDTAAASGIIDFTDARLLEALAYNPNLHGSINALVHHPDRQLPVFIFRRPTIRTPELLAVQVLISATLATLGHLGSMPAAHFDRLCPRVGRAHGHIAIVLPIAAGETVPVIVPFETSLPLTASDGPVMLNKAGLDLLADTLRQCPLVVPPWRTGDAYVPPVLSAATLDAHNGRIDFRTGLVFSMSDATPAISWLEAKHLTPGWDVHSPTTPETALDWLASRIAAPHARDNVGMFETMQADLLKRFAPPVVDDFATPLPLATSPAAAAVASPALPNLLHKDTAPVPSVLESLAQIEAWLPNLDAQRIVVLPRALRSAKRHRHPLAPVIGDALTLLGTLRHAAFQGERDAIAAYTHGLAELKLHDGWTNAEHLKGVTGGDYVATFRGDRLLLDRKIASNSNRFNGNRLIRIYYGYHRPSRTIVVGHLPDHLPTLSS